MYKPKNYIMRDKHTGEVVPKESIRRDSGGDEFLIRYATRATEPGKSGKVWCRRFDDPHNEVWHQELYAHIFDLTVEEVEDEV